MFESLKPQPSPLPPQSFFPLRGIPIFLALRALQPHCWVALEGLIPKATPAGAGCLFHSEAGMVDAHRAGERSASPSVEEHRESGKALALG